MKLLKNRLLYLKVWNKGIYFAIGRPISDNVGDYILRLWINFPNEKKSELTSSMYKVK